MNSNDEIELFLDGDTEDEEEEELSIKLDQVTPTNLQSKSTRHPSMELLKNDPQIQELNRKLSQFLIKKSVTPSGKASPQKHFDMSARRRSNSMKLSTKTSQLLSLKGTNVPKHILIEREKKKKTMVRAKEISPFAKYAVSKTPSELFEERMKSQQQQPKKSLVKEKEHVARRRSQSIYVLKKSTGATLFDASNPNKYQGHNHSKIQSSSIVKTTILTTKNNVPSPPQYPLEPGNYNRNIYKINGKYVPLQPAYPPPPNQPIPSTDEYKKHDQWIFKEDDGLPYEQEISDDELSDESFTEMDIFHEMDARANLNGKPVENDKNDEKKIQSNILKDKKEKQTNFALNNQGGKPPTSTATTPDVFKKIVSIPSIIDTKPSTTSNLYQSVPTQKSPLTKNSIDYDENEFETKSQKVQKHVSIVEEPEIKEYDCDESLLDHLPPFLEEEPSPEIIHQEEKETEIKNSNNQEDLQTNKPKVIGPESDVEIPLATTIKTPDQETLNQNDSEILPQNPEQNKSETLPQTPEQNESETLPQIPEEKRELLNELSPYSPPKVDHLKEDAIGKELMVMGAIEKLQARIDSLQVKYENALDSKTEAIEKYRESLLARDLALQRSENDAEEIALLKSEVSKLQSEVKRIESKSHTAVHDYDQLVMDNETLKNKLNHIQEEYSTYQGEIHTNHMNALSQKDQKYEALENKMKNVQKDSEIYKTNATNFMELYNRLEKEYAVVKANISDITEEGDQPLIATLVQKHTTQLQEEREKYHQLSIKFSAAEAQIDALSSRLDTSETKIGLLNESLHSKAGKVVHFELRVNDLLDENDKLREKFERMQLEHIKLLDRHHQLQKDYSVLEFESKQSAISSKNVKTESEVRKEYELQKLEKELLVREDALQTKVNDLKEKRELLTQQQQQHKAMVKKHNSFFTTRHHDLEKKSERLRNQLERAKQVTQNYQELKELADANSGMLHHKIEKLQTQLDSRQRAYRTLLKGYRYLKDHYASHMYLSTSTLNSSTQSAKSPTALKYFPNKSVPPDSPFEVYGTP